MEKKHLSGLIKSDYLLTEILSYWGYLGQVDILLKSLSHGGHIFLTSNKEQLLHFCQEKKNRLIIEDTYGVQCTMKGVTRRNQQVEIKISSYNAKYVGQFLFNSEKFKLIVCNFLKCSKVSEQEDIELILPAVDLILQKANEVKFTHFQHCTEALLLKLLPKLQESKVKQSIQFEMNNQNMKTLESLQVKHPSTKYKINFMFEKYLKFTEKWIKYLNNLDKESIVSLYLFKVNAEDLSYVSLFSRCKENLTNLKKLKMNLNSKEIMLRFDSLSSLTQLEKFTLYDGQFDFNLLKHWPKIQALQITSILEVTVQTQDVSHVNKLRKFNLSQKQKSSLWQHSTTQQLIMNLITSEKLKYLTFHEMPRKYIPILFKMNTSLVTLQLYNLVGVDLKFISEINKNLSLERLVLHFVANDITLKDKSEEELAKINFLKNNIKTLDILGGRYLLNKNINIEQFGSLKSLTLLTQDQTDGHLNDFFQRLFIEKDTKLLRLNLSFRTCYPAICDIEEVTRFFKILSQKEQLLKSLTIHQVPDESFDSMIQFLNSNKSLTYFSVQNARFHCDDQFQQLLEAVKSHPSLKDLSLQMIDLNPRKYVLEMDQIADMVILACQNLKKLNLYTWVGPIAPLRIMPSQKPYVQGFEKLHRDFLNKIMKNLPNLESLSS